MGDRRHRCCVGGGVGGGPAPADASSRCSAWPFPDLEGSISSHHTEIAGLRTATVRLQPQLIDPAQRMSPMCLNAALHRYKVFSQLVLAFLDTWL